MYRSVFLIVVSALLSVVATYVLLHEVGFGQEARQAQAVVEDYISRRGKGAATVSFEWEGKTVKAHLRTWFQPLRIGERVSVLYLPSQPTIVELDSFWQRFLLPIGCLAIFGTLGFVELRTVLKNYPRAKNTPAQRVSTEQRA
jgi:uncharacterized protein DUF3592